MAHTSGPAVPNRQPDGSQSPPRILVTGASGLLGINLALEASRAASVFGLVNDHPLHLNAADQQDLFHGRFTPVRGDLNTPGTAQRLLDEIQPDWVIHCAALANLDACEADPDLAHQVNQEVPRFLARYVARGGARFLHVSTDAVFDGLAGNYCESDPTNPIGVYAQTKLGAERAVLEEYPQAIVARVNLFGFSPSGKRSLSEFFLYNLLAGRTVMGFTDVIFCPLLANHLAQVFLEMLQKNLSGLYHVVSSECLSKYEFGLRITRRFGLDENLIQPKSVSQAGLIAARSPNLSLRTDKLTQALGHPTPNISAGLECFYQLYQAGYPQTIQNLF